MMLEIVSTCKKVSVVSMAALLSACVSMAPDYERPDSPVVDGWSTNQDQAADASIRTLGWREFVLDERLRQVIELSLNESRDLRQALYDIEAARAEYRVQRADRLPGVDASVDGSRARSLDSTGGTSISESGQATIGISAFELDLFGRVKSLSDTALESYLSTFEGARATQLTLVGDVVSAWLTLAADRQRLQLAKETRESAQRSLELAQRRYDIGVATRLDVYDAQTVEAQARYDLANLTATVAQDRNALNLLAGSPVASELLPEGLPEDTSVWLASVPEGMSSDLLLQRPDVLSAEHQLKSANANIGAARAAYFPTISLTGLGGLASGDLSELFDGERIWSFSPSVTLPIFDAGSRNADLDYAWANRNSLLAAYELSIQTAFQEVADALAERDVLLDRRQAQEDLVSAARDSLSLSTRQYEVGVEEYLNVLQAQRTLYSAEDTLISEQLAALSNRINLYRTTGGGTETDGLMPLPEDAGTEDAGE